MALFGTNNLLLIAFGLGGIILLIVLCIVIYLCRRRCVQRRIQEALEIQENYLAPSMAQIPQNPQITHVPSASNQTNNTMPPNVNMKSLTMLNIAEESDDNDAITVEKTDSVSAGKTGKKRHRILDLSSDVANDEHMDIQSSHHITKDSASNIPIAHSQSSKGGTLNAGTAKRRHFQQTSFVLDSEVDYYTQVQEMDTEYRRGTVSHQRNTDIIDDDEDDDDEEDNIDINHDPHT